MMMAMKITKNMSITLAMSRIIHYDNSDNDKDDGKNVYVWNTM